MTNNETEFANQDEEILRGDGKEKAVLEAYIGLFTPERILEYEIHGKRSITCEFAGTDFYYDFEEGTREYKQLKIICAYLNERAKEKKDEQGNE